MMTPVPVGCVVEGHGEVEAAPIPIRRIADRMGVPVAVLPPLCVRKDKLLRTDQLERAVELEARKLGGRGIIVVLIDADDDCPAKLGPEMLHRAVRQRSDLPTCVVLANREFEAWFLAAAESLAGRRGLARHLQSPPEPEAIRGAKEWLSRRMEGDRSYAATLDQPKLAAALDLDLARRADSFDKLYRDLTRLLSAYGRNSPD